jgi:transposase
MMTNEIRIHCEEPTDMMGHEPPSQGTLYHYNIHLDARVRQNHPLRKIKELIDFSFIYDEVKDTYGTNGNVSVPPPVILKLMLLLVLYNVRSERELIQTLPERLDWLWFLGLDLDSPIPDHSVLSKARTRWGKEAFHRFFEMIVSRCVHAHLVDGTKLFVDASIIEADASNNSLIDTKRLSLASDELERRLDDHPWATINKRYVSSTDPDAALIRDKGRSHLAYKTHRAVDPASEVITAVKVTDTTVNEAHELLPLIKEHEKTTDSSVTTVVADSKYGITENYLACH